MKKIEGTLHTQNIDRSGLRLAIIGPLAVIVGACLFISGIKVGMRWGEEKAVSELQPQIDYNAAEMSVLNDRIIGLQESLSHVVIASYYGPRFHGRVTASGVRFDRHAMTAASRWLPFGSRWTVENMFNGKSVSVVINDRGPFIGDRAIDLSEAAARAIGLIEPGVLRVKLSPEYKP